VRYSWDVPQDAWGWREASKGGGYSKWAGLHHYRIYWGTDGAAIQANPGSAVRNLDQLDRANLVYSDTGTLGMNVRIRRPGEIFMASGPGITVQEGNPLAHLAFLNSRFASYLMRLQSPKLTISAGYIGKLPFLKEMSDDATLVALAQECVRIKQECEARTLPSDLWEGPECLIRTSIEDGQAAITRRFRLELKRLERTPLLSSHRLSYRLEEPHRLAGTTRACPQRWH